MLFLSIFTAIVAKLKYFYDDIWTHQHIH